LNNKIINNCPFLISAQALPYKKERTACLGANFSIYGINFIPHFFAFISGRNMVTKTVVILLIGLFTLDLAQIGISGENQFSSVRSL